MSWISVAMARLSRLLKTAPRELRADSDGLREPQKSPEWKETQLGLAWELHIQDVCED